ncbi:hypothetical protein U0070_010920 [Myodes glareolus]|uniref:Uncharacterized protein n=1 Tax=Myodes glareolus TaxID=447135 RepID=A0AAW0HZZ3_MYOGA
MELSVGVPPPPPPSPPPSSQPCCIPTGEENQDNFLVQRKPELADCRSLTADLDDITQTKATCFSLPACFVSQLERAVEAAALETTKSNGEREQQAGEEEALGMQGLLFSAIARLPEKVPLSNKTTTTTETQRERELAERAAFVRNLLVGVREGPVHILGHHCVLLSQVWVCSLAASSNGEKRKDQLQIYTALLAYASDAAVLWLLESFIHYYSQTPRTSENQTWPSFKINSSVLPVNYVLAQAPLPVIEDIRLSQKNDQVELRRVTSSGTCTHCSLTLDQRNFLPWSEIYVVKLARMRDNCMLSPKRGIYTNYSLLQYTGNILEPFSTAALFPDASLSEQGQSSILVGPSLGKRAPGSGVGIHRKAGSYTRAVDKRNPRQRDGGHAKRIQVEDGEQGAAPGEEKKLTSSLKQKWSRPSEITKPVVWELQTGETHWGNALAADSASYAGRHTNFLTPASGPGSEALPLNYRRGDPRSGPHSQALAPNLTINHDREHTMLNSERSRKTSKVLTLKRSAENTAEEHHQVKAAPMCFLRLASNSKYHTEPALIAFGPLLL